MAFLLRPSRAIATCFIHSLASSTLANAILDPYKLSVGFHLRTILDLSCTFSSYSKLFTSKAGNFKPTMLTMLTYHHQDFCLSSSHGKKLEFKSTKMPSKDFCTFIETEPKSEIVAFFREIVTELECNRKVLDFHMRIVNCEADFKVEIYYGVEKSGPAILPSSSCISCYPHVPLFPGQEPIVEARECVLEEFSSHPYAVCRLDAKGRCGFVITPVRHVHRMSDLDDEELFGLWSLAVQVLRETDLPFTNMILNHGTYRNVEHLHLKVWVDKDVYERYRLQWSNERQELWERLQELAMKRPKKGLRLKKKVLSL